MPRGSQPPDQPRLREVEEDSVDGARRDGREALGPADVPVPHGDPVPEAHEPEVHCGSATGVDVVPSLQCAPPY